MLKDKSAEERCGYRHGYCRIQCKGISCTTICYSRVGDKYSDLASDDFFIEPESSGL